MLRTFYLLPVTYNKIMSNLKDFLMGTQILKEIESPINGKIQVVRSLGLGTYIQVGGLTQSGGILEGVWRKPLKKVYQSLITNHQSLILGLGGGTACDDAKHENSQDANEKPRDNLASHFWPPLVKYDVGTKLLWHL